MGIFKKTERQKVTEEQLACDYITMTINGINQEWSNIKEHFSPYAGCHSEKLNSEATQVELVLASIGVNMVWLSILFPTDRAKRIRDHILDRLSELTFGHDANEAIESYELAWKYAKESGEPPLPVLVSVFRDHLCIEYSNLTPFSTDTNDELKIDFLNIALCGVIQIVTTMHFKWWRTFHSNYSVI